MTVTIKKNVDVQATLEAKQFKYQVKRDLSGDVQFENMASPARATVSPTFGATIAYTATVASNDGWNFIKPAAIQVVGSIRASNVGTTVSAAFFFKGSWLTNNNARNVYSATASCSAATSCSASINVTIVAGASLTVAQSAPNVIKNRIYAGQITGSVSAISAYAAANDDAQGQKNQKVTVMK